MRVLVTGIDGFVGSHAADLLTSIPDVEVHGVVLQTRSLRNIAHLKNSLTLHQADISDRSRVQEIIERVQPERILHIAGQAFVPASLEDPMATFQANLIGGLSVLEAARLQKISTGHSPAVLLVTSGEVYGRVDADKLPITELFPLEPNTPYAASKASLDMIAQQYARCFGVDVTIVRPFNHAGPRQNPAFVVSDFAKQFASIVAGHQEPVIHVGNIAIRRDFTDVRDVVRAYWGLFSRASDDIVFNVASCKGVEIREILETLQDISGATVRVVQDRERFRSYDLPLVVASYARLENATGWTPRIPFRQTLHDAYANWLDEVRASVPNAASTSL
jgi:GDP-4-dehydro-6-deoxy-D-mannose reductase